METLKDPRFAASVSIDSWMREYGSIYLPRPGTKPLIRQDCSALSLQQDLFRFLNKAMTRLAQTVSFNRYVMKFIFKSKNTADAVIQLIAGDNNRSNHR